MQPAKKTRPWASFLIVAPLLLAALLLAGCAQGPQPLLLSGPTMGTQYHITISRVPPDLDPEQLHQGVKAVLAEVNGQMSTYDPGSELSRFNAAEQGQWFPVSATLVALVEQAQAIAALTSGAFDPTVGPLVNLWGFGPDGQPQRVPAGEAIANALSRVDYQAVETRAQPPALRKFRDVYLDLSAIAKGYGCDAVAAYLEQQGVTDYLVEIGGELRLAGLSPRGTAWRIGIEAPQLQPGVAERALTLSDVGMATSGDYRNYFERDGRRYSHTLNPLTGQPIRHKVASVTVIAETTASADGLATGLLVMGAERALALAAREDLAVYLLVRVDDGFEARFSQAFEPYLMNPAAAP